MAKRTNGGTTKTTTTGESKATSETKARRAPARRRTDKTTTDAPVATASDAAVQERPDTMSTARASQNDVTPSPEEVRRRAYEIYCGRGGKDGCDVDDWLEAERQLRNRTH
jgi:hypothetical protein